MASAVAHSVPALPDRVDARYLLGIVRNVHEQREGELIAETLLRLRRKAHDIALFRLSHERDALCAAAHLDSDVLALLVDRALLAERALDRTFWLDALATFVNDASPDERDGQYRNAARCIHATFRATPPPARRARPRRASRALA